MNTEMIPMKYTHPDIQKKRITLLLSRKREYMNVIPDMI